MNSRSTFDWEFYKGKRVFLTGHTGFKGRWLSRMLIKAGAEVTGYSLAPATAEDALLYENMKLSQDMHSVEGDIRDLAHLQQALKAAKPEIVLHLAAQPIVRESYVHPVDTFAINVMGTVNLLEAIRQSDTVRSVINVTTDKVYENREWPWGYRENEPLKGYDPYSNSKSCSELVTYSYQKSFLDNMDIRVSTVRAGNVIGGGDFAKDRIIPDCIRAASRGEAIKIRNPHSTRPYQHVLEPLSVYLMIAQKQYENAAFSSNYNVGPDDRDCVTTGELATLFCEKWGEHAVWQDLSENNAPHEAQFLKLDCSKLKQTFQWKPGWTIEEAVEMTVEWAKAWKEQDVWAVMDKQIDFYFA